MKKFLFNDKFLNILLCVSAFLFIYLQTVLFNSVDMDYWARLLQGSAFWQTGHILKIDPFSYTNTHLWLDHEWGASIVFSFVQRFGYSFVLLFKALIVFFTFFFIYKTVRLISPEKNRLFDFFYFVIAVFAMPTIAQSWLRCHFFTFLFFAFSLFILEKVRKDRNYKLLVILPFLMLIWCNMHGGCVSLLGLLLIYAAGEFLNKKSFIYYLVALLFCFFVMFINPYGLDYVKFIFMAVTMKRPFVTEWISPFSHTVWSFLWEFKLLFIVNLLLLLFNLKNLKKDYTKYFLLIVCAYLSFRYVKNTPFFIIVSMIFLYDVFSEIIKNIINRLKISVDIKLLSILLYLGLIIFSLYGIQKNIISVFLPDLSQQPVKVVQFIKSNELKGNILAPFDMGSYIIYKLYPDNLIYMDGRYEEVYYKETKDFVDKFYNVNEDWDEILNQNEYRHDYIIIPSDAMINDYISKRNDYKLIYNDSNNNLYVRTDIIKASYAIPRQKFDFESQLQAFSTNVKFK